MSCISAGHDQFGNDNKVLIDIYQELCSIVERIYELGDTSQRGRRWVLQKSEWLSGGERE